MKIRYIDRTRDYYRAQGFKADYAWSTNDETPFTPLTKPLSECTVTFVTTAVVESDIPKPIRTAQHYDFESAPASSLLKNSLGTKSRRIRVIEVVTSLSRCFAHSKRRVSLGISPLGSTLFQQNIAND